MEIEFLIEKDDLAALYDYGVASTRAKKRPMILLRYIVGFLLIVVGIWILSYRVGLTMTPLSAIVILVSVLLIMILLRYWLQRQTRKAFLRAYDEGENRAIIGERRLRILDEAMEATSRFSSGTIRWEAIERIESTDSHTFIFISTVSAHAIPKHKIISGDYDAFVAAARERFEQAHAGQSGA